MNEDQQNQNNEAPEEFVDTSTSMDTQPTSEAPAEKHGMLGPVVGVLVIVLVLILGGLYLWGTTLQNETPTPYIPSVERPSAEANNEPESTNAEADVETMSAVSTSDEIEAIEADIESTELDELDAELDAIEAELDAALSDV